MSITSTLDREVQTVLENLASRYVEKIKNGINNTAIAVIDTQNMEMLGYLGSVDFSMNQYRVKLTEFRPDVHRDPLSSLLYMDWLWNRV